MVSSYHSKPSGKKNSMSQRTKFFISFIPYMQLVREPHSLEVDFFTPVPSIGSVSVIL